MSKYFTVTNIDADQLSDLSYKFNQLARFANMASYLRYPFHTDSHRKS